MKELIEKTIEYWKGIKAGALCGYGDTSAPLCYEYFTRRGCPECPVEMGSGRSFCTGTPWEDFHKHQIESHRVYKYAGQVPYGTVSECEKCKELAQKVIDYLEGLKN